MNKNFLNYLRESIALNLPHSEKEKEPLLIKSDEKQISDIPRMKTDYDEIKKLNQANRRLKQQRASLLKKHNLKIENGQLKEREPIVNDDGQLDLFGQKEVSNKINEFNNDVKAKLEELQDEIHKTTPDYKKNLKVTLKKFFMVGGKLPKRYIYLPVSNQINLAEIEKINKNQHLDMLLKIKNGAYAQLDLKDQELFDYLIDNGYTLTKEQYVKNICVNQNGKSVPIDKELVNINMIDIEKKKKAIEKQKNQDIIEKINFDIARKENFKSSFLETIQNVKKNSNILNNSVIILTWVPRLIMAQSTNTIWRSCMTYSFVDNLHGVNIHYVPKGIQAGMFIAWLVSLDDRHIKKPMARALIKPSGRENISFFWPSTIYTESGERNLINLFDTALKKYCFLKQQDILGKSEIIRIQTRREVYDDRDSERSIINFGAIINNLKSKSEQYFDPSVFIREYLRPSLVTFDFKEEDFDFLFNYKPLVDYVSGQAYEPEIHAYYHFLASKIIELQKYSYFSEFFKNKDVITKLFILKQVFYENSLNTLFLENPQGLKYFLNLCYEKDYLKKIEQKQLDIIRRSFIELHSKCSIYPHYGRFIKTCYDRFGKDIYSPQKIDENIRQLFYSDIKVNEILVIYRDLDLQFERFGVLLTVLFKNNRDNFYAFYKLAKFQNSDLVQSQLMEIVISTLYSKKYNDFDEIISFIKKEKIMFNSQSYGMIAGYTKLNFPIGLYSLIFEKKLNMINYYQKLLDIGFNLVEFLEKINPDSLLKSPNDVNLTLIYDFFLKNQKNEIFENEYRQLTEFFLENEKIGEAIFKDVLSGIMNGNIAYSYLIDFLTFLPKYPKNDQIRLNKLPDYIINNNLNKKEVDVLLDLLDQKNLLINGVSSFKAIILSDNSSYYSRYLNEDYSISGLLWHFNSDVVNKMIANKSMKDKNFYQIRDRFVNFIIQNHKSFKKQKIDIRKFFEKCNIEAVFIMIPIFKKLINLIEVTGSKSIEDEIEFQKKSINFSYFFSYAIAMYENDPKKLEEDLKLIGPPNYIHKTFKILNEQGVLFEMANFDKMYFTRGYFDLIMQYSITEEEKSKIFEAKCIEFATNHHPNGQKSEFYTIDDLKLFIAFIKNNNKEKLFKDIVNNHVLTEEYAEYMYDEYKICERNDPELLYRNFINYLRAQPHNNPLLPYIDKEIFIDSVFLKNPLLTGSRIGALDAVIKSEDIKNKFVEDTIKRSLKTRYSDATKPIIMSKLIKLFGKNKIDELKNS